jgi:hypothetical protein
MPECDWVIAALIFLAAALLTAAEYSAPAGTRPAIRRPGALHPARRSVIAPISQYITGPGPFGAISPSGKMVVSANSGPGDFRYSSSTAIRAAAVLFATWLW